MTSSLALYTDRYQLTMLAAYARTGLAGRRAVFELFVRRLPPSRRFLVACGIGRAVPLLEGLRWVYSLFANPNAEAVLERTAGEATRFIVFGVATDYCVRAATFGLLEWLARGRRGEVWLVHDAVAAVKRADGVRTLAECAERNVRLVSIEQALEAL